MIRKFSMFRRFLTPRKLVLLVLLACLGYLALHEKSLSSNSHPPRDILSVEPNEKSEKFPVSKDERNENVHEIEISSLNKAISEKDIENSRQTVQHLLDDVFHQKSSTPTKKTIRKGGICPEVADISDLQGALPQAVLLIQNLKEGEVSAVHPELAPGGHWKPSDCEPRYKIAIIVPYRDRQSHLTRLIDFLVPILQRQLLDFRFIVTEQFGNDLFNKGRIMNAAFRLAEKLEVNCVVFHDVDMFPQDDRNPYTCPPTPRHLGAFVSNLGYQLWYKEIVGGALAISMNDFRFVNGYSNMYWAWGGEDDDMGARILSLNLTIERPNPTTGRYSMLKHVKRKRTAPKLIYKLLENSDKRVPYDGVNETDKWKVVKLTIRPLYYHMYVDVGPVPDEWREKKE